MRKLNFRFDKAEQGSIRGWLTHPITQHVHAGAVAQRAESFSVLLSACGQSSDVTVTRALYDYLKFDELVKLTEGQT